MGGASAAGAVVHLRTLWHVSLLASLMGPRARSRNSHQIAPAPLAAVAKYLCRWVAHDQESQLGIGRHAGRVANLSRTTEDSHYFTVPRLANARRGGIQIGNHSGVDPRGVVPQARLQEPFVAHFPITRGATFRFPNLKPACNEWS